MKRAVAFILYRDEKILVVWHKGTGGWTLPGGKVEPGETLFQANARELREETGLELLKQKLVYQAINSSGVQVSVCCVLLVIGEPREAEPGSPVSWLSRDELVRLSPYTAFYGQMFLTLRE